MKSHRTNTQRRQNEAVSGRVDDSSVEQVVGSCLTAVVDFALVAVLLVAPLLMGGRHPAGKLVLAVIIWTMAIAWFARQCLQRRAHWSWTGAEWILLLSSVLIVIQICPLPSAGLQLLSPSQREFLPLWSAQSSVYGAWQYVSLTPERTRQGLCLFLAYAALFLIAYQRVRTVADVERLLRWIAVAVVAMAGLGLLQYLIGNGKFLWIYEHPTRSTHQVVKGSFANQNHFAHFLALGMGPLIWCLQDWYQRSRGSNSEFSAKQSGDGAASYVSSLLLTGLGLVTFAGLLSFSRGGWLVISLAVLVCVGIYVAYGFVNRRAIVVLVGLLVVMTAAVFVHGHQRLKTRLHTVTEGSLEEIDAQRGRRRIWSAVGDAVPHFSVMGAGVGSHRDVYPTFMKEWSKTEYSHAESGYLQVLLETGIPGLLLLIAAIGLSGYWLVSSLRNSTSPRISAIAGALVAGWAVTVVHSFVDFVWYIPACLSVTILMAAAAGRLHRLAGEATSEPRCFSRSGWLVGMIVVIGIAVVGVRAQLAPARAAPYWERYLTMSLAAEDAALDRMRRSRQPRAGEIDDSDPATIARMSSLLQEAIARDPNDARAHLRLAATHLSHFATLQESSENAMSLGDIRGAAIMSQFPTRSAQDAWLDVAIGRHRHLLDAALWHARQAVRLSPLQGKGYLHLAELSFLEGQNEHRDALLAQAKHARPYDGAVLYVIGAEAHLAGDLKTATECYQQAFNRGPEMQDLIISMLAPSTQPHEFISTFQPDRIGLGKLYDYYRSNSAEFNARFVAHHYVRALQRHAQSASGAQAARSWYLAQEVHDFLQQLPESLAAARHAVAADPSDYRLHYLLAIRLQQHGDVDQALDEYRWCLRRRPNDKAVLRRVARLSPHQTR